MAKTPARTHADHARLALRLHEARLALEDALATLKPGSIRVHNQIVRAIERINGARNLAEDLMFQDFDGKPPEPRLYYLPIDEVLRRLEELS